MSSLLIAPAELAERMAYQRPVRLLDARPVSQFAAGHLAGALHLDPFGISLIDTRPAPLEAFEWIMRHLLELRGVARDEPTAFAS
jgi:rhodanese-related sulfurtransferase